MKWWPVAVLSLFLAACSSFGTTQDRWSDRYEAQWKIFESMQKIRHDRMDYLMRLLENVSGETRGVLMALMVMDMGDDFRDYADVLAAVTPPDRTAGEILAQGVADVLPFAAFGASVGWMNSAWARHASSGPTVPTTDNRVSYHSGGDMGFGSWNPSTVTTTTTSIPSSVPGGP
jgi:hypothetical protein